MQQIIRSEESKNTKILLSILFRYPTVYYAPNKKMGKGTMKVELSTLDMYGAIAMVRH